VVLLHQRDLRLGGKFVGLKRKRKDLAMIVSDTPCTIAAAFTTNKVKAAPVLWNQDIYENHSTIRGLVVNSGNANSCTGQKGVEDNEKMAQTMANLIGVKKEEILVASTGVIGVEMPINQIVKGMGELFPEMNNNILSGVNAAEAIMTTDTMIKTISVKIEIGGKEVHIGGMAKGSGMIHPNMATMLSFITTDLEIL